MYIEDICSQLLREKNKFFMTIVKLCSLSACVGFLVSHIQVFWLVVRLTTEVFNSVQISCLTLQDFLVFLEVNENESSKLKFFEKKDIDVCFYKYNHST